MKWLDKILTSYGPVSEPDKYIYLNEQRTRISRNEIVKVSVITIDSGPFIIDVLWRVKTQNKEFVIPRGASDEDDVRRSFEKFPNFNHKALPDAMSSPEIKEFICWQKENSS